MIARSIGTAYKKKMLKNIGEIEDDDLEFDGEASRPSSKYLVLGSDNSVPFDKNLLTESSVPSPASHIIE